MTSEEIKDLLELARLAPSSHNTQPWRVTINGDSVTIGYDPKRQLTVGDPDKRELFMSLGAFIETLCLAALDQGCSGACQVLGDKPGSVAKVTFSGAGEPDHSWKNLITARRSDRRFYETRPLAKTALSKLRSLAHGQAYLTIFDQPDDINFLSDITRQATLDLMTPQPFRDELAGWVRPNMTKKHDGMPGYTQGMPAPVSLLAKLVIGKTKKVAGDQAKKDSQRIARSAAVGIVCISSNTVEAWIDAGRVYQSACLQALAEDIKTSGVSAAVIQSDTVAEITKKLELDGTPVALIRFGYAKGSVRTTPRLSVSEFTS